MRLGARGRCGHRGHGLHLDGVVGDVREHRDGTRYVYTQDPWGNTIEILQTGSKSA